eukprot:scaffold63598_cov54-Phaeocystis_antarctica.AAC.4
MARNTSSEAVYEANADWLEATGGLRLADVLSVHDAIHDPTKTQVTLSTGHTLPVVVSANGCRRVDMVVDPGARPKGRCKLMAQNLKTGSKAAQRASQGAAISHIIPLDAQGRHTAAQYSHDWGMVEEGKLAKHCRAVLNAQDVASATGKRAEPPPKRRKVDAAPRRFLNCPIAEKGAAKALGAKWDAAQRKWFVPEGLEMAPFVRWDPTAPTPTPSPTAPSAADGSTSAAGGSTPEAGDFTPVDPNQANPALAAGRAMREATGATYRGNVPGVNVPLQEWLGQRYFDLSNMGGFGIEDMSAEDTWERRALEMAFAGYKRWLQKGASDQEAADNFNGLLALAVEERKREAQPQAGSRQAPVLVD